MQLDSLQRGFRRFNAGRKSLRWPSNVRNAPHGVILEASKGACDVHEYEPKDGKMMSGKSNSRKKKNPAHLAQKDLPLTKDESSSRAILYGPP